MFYTQDKAQTTCFHACKIYFKKTSPTSAYFRPRTRSQREGGNSYSGPDLKNMEKIYMTGNMFKKKFPIFSLFECITVKKISNKVYGEKYNKILPTYPFSLTPNSY
jgi:hypothetical protein